MRRLPSLLSFGLVVALVIGLVAGLSGCGGASREVPAIRSTAGEVKPLVYVALGDSYTGAPRVGTRLNEACNRTDGNYPRLFAALRLQAGTPVKLTDVSCGGARIRDLRRSQKATVARQLAAVRADADLVTVAVGGNDVKIMGLVSACVTTPSTCRRRSEAVVSGVRRMRTDLVAALRLVKKRAPRARVVVIGYPEILPRSGRCGKANAATVKRARIALDRIAIAQRNAARQAGALFLDPRTATRGHGLCTEDPWIALTTTATSQRFHPIAAEQEAVAVALDRLVRTRQIGVRAP